MGPVSEKCKRPASRSGQQSLRIEVVANADAVEFYRKEAGPEYTELSEKSVEAGALFPLLLRKTDCFPLKRSVRRLLPHAFNTQLSVIILSIFCVSAKPGCGHLFSRHKNKTRKYGRKGNSDVQFVDWRGRRSRYRYDGGHSGKTAKTIRLPCVHCKEFYVCVRGGHNFLLMRFATEPIYSHSNQLDGIVALDNETIVLHQNQLKENGFILCDSKLSAEDPRLIKVADPASEYNGEGEYLRYRYSENGITPRLIPGKSKHLVSIDSDEYDERGWITESAEVRTQMMDKRMKKIERLKTYSAGRSPDRRREAAALG